MPNFMEATLESIRSAVGLAGQREVFLDQLPRLQMPTLIMWGIEDRVIPLWHAGAAVSRLEKGALELIPNCGHLPHVEQPKRFVSILEDFLGGL
jgi:4,5:9,10-diseco-3-hydroxy-5,9,17-trioxoandrosta-1(10),2-diene-4-oate hydrolase